MKLLRLDLLVILVLNIKKYEAALCYTGTQRAPEGGFEWVTLPENHGHCSVTVLGGYRMNELVNPEDQSCKNCDEHSECLISEISGDYKCSCLDGFTADGITCADIDECGQGLHDCHDNAVCVNTIGSFHCTCKHGYEGNGHNCSDVNECFLPNQCDYSPEATCVNTKGSYYCKCQDGYEFTAKEKFQFDSFYYHCQDIDECSVDHLNVCSTIDHAECINTAGSYICECEIGFIKIETNGTGGEEFYCEDINECYSLPNPCDYSPDVTCVNFEGSYSCQCPDGYNLTAESIDGDSFSYYHCHDIDECSVDDLNVCSAINHTECINTEGSYICECEVGFMKIETNGTGGQEFYCEDIDECAVDHQVYMDCNAIDNSNCINTEGSYICVCDVGYVKVVTETLTVPTSTLPSCQGVDECPEDLEDACSLNKAKCVIMDNCSHSCECEDGLEKIYTNGMPSDYPDFYCADIDECVKETHDCTKGLSFCTNTFGSYRCDCYGNHTGSPGYCPECPGEYPRVLEHSESVYCVVTLDQDWHTARDTCQSFGFHLITVESEDENLFIENNLYDYINNDNIWIGLNDLLDEGNWTWVAEGTDVKYQNWGEDPAHGQHCGSYDVYDFPGKWVAIDCSATLYSLCEFEKGSNQRK